MLSLSHILNPESVDFHRTNRFPATPPSLTSPVTQYDSPVLSTEKVRMPRSMAGRDASKFPIESLPKGDVNFPPFDKLLPDSRELVQRFGIESLHDIRYHCLHIPYNSGKKEFGLKTGRESLEVFRYVFKNPQDDTAHVVMWDYQIGLVRITPFFKSCKFAKTAPAKMLNMNPGLREISHSITGGSISAQGYWMPYRCAKAVCATFCYNIAGALIPIFGPDFPSLCIRPGTPEFNQWVIDPEIVREATREADVFRERYGKGLDSMLCETKDNTSLVHESQAMSLAQADRNAHHPPHLTDRVCMEPTERQRDIEGRKYTSEVDRQLYPSRTGSSCDVWSPSRSGGSMLPRQHSTAYAVPWADLQEPPRHHQTRLPSLDPRFSAVPTTSRPYSYQEDLIPYPRERSHYHRPQINPRPSPSLSPHQPGFCYPDEEYHSDSRTRTRAMEEPTRLPHYPETSYRHSSYNADQTAARSTYPGPGYEKMPRLGVEEEEEEARRQYYSRYQPDSYYERGPVVPYSSSFESADPAIAREIQEWCGGPTSQQRPNKARRVTRAWTRTEDENPEGGAGSVQQGHCHHHHSNFPSRREGEELYSRSQAGSYPGPLLSSSTSPSKPTQRLSYVRDAPYERRPPPSPTPRARISYHPHQEEEEQAWSRSTRDPHYYHHYHHHHQAPRDSTRTAPPVVQEEEQHQKAAAAALLLGFKNHQPEPPPNSTVQNKSNSPPRPWRKRSRINHLEDRKEDLPKAAHKTIMKTIEREDDDGEQQAAVAQEGENKKATPQPQQQRQLRNRRTRQGGQSPDPHPPPLPSAPATATTNTPSTLHLQRLRNYLLGPEIEEGELEDEEDEEHRRLQERSVTRSLRSQQQQQGRRARKLSVSTRSSEDDEQQQQQQQKKEKKKKQRQGEP